MLSILAVAHVKGQHNLSFSVRFKSVPLNTAIFDGEKSGSFRGLRYEESHFLLEKMTIKIFLILSR